MAHLTDPTARIAHLERQLAHLQRRLALAQQLVRDRTGLDLSDMIDSAEASGEQGVKSGISERQPAATRAAPPHPPSCAVHRLDGTDPAPSAAENNAPVDTSGPVDVGPFVLRALALRKRIHLGETSEVDGENELREMFEGEAAALSEEQRASVRQWAGL
ncbi:hypothetical protein JCM3775_000486 [Rhodotorula graminis]